eukprot:jgi/Undpi1/7160/HiC_scaffold_22.g09634.m1
MFLCNRFERATKEAVQTLARRDMPTKDLAAAIRRCLNNLWRGKSFLFEDGGLRIIVFQSAPPSPLPQPPVQLQPPGAGAADQPPAGKNAAERTGIKVLRSEMDQAFQKRVLGVASVAAKQFGKDGKLDGIVTDIKTSLTELTGPVWHVVATRGAGDWGHSVAHEDGQLLDFKLNGDRIVAWKHAQAPPGLADMITAKRISSFLFVATVLLLCLYINMQSSCDTCCSSNPTKRARAGCPGSSLGGDAGVGGAAEAAKDCGGGDTDDADRCLRNATALFFITCGTLATATAVKDLRDVHGILEEAMADIVSELWWDRAFRAGEQGASGLKVAEVLPAHDAETISSSSAQHTLGKLANRIRYEGRVALLDQLPETRPQRGTGESQKRRRREAWRGPGNGVNRDRPATESIGIRGSRLLKGEACRLC